MRTTRLDALEAKIAPASGAVVLMYHSVSDGSDREWVDPSNDMPSDIFREQMAFLARERRVVSMGELVDARKRGDELPPGAVALTFDDGYLNNLRVAAPILKEFGLPATLYLPTRYIDGGETQWVDRLFVAFERRTRHALQIDTPILAIEANLSVRQRAADAKERFRALLLSASYADRNDLLAQLESQLAPSGSPPRSTMNWEDVRRLTSQYPGWEIGAHTVGHRDLNACDAAEAELEVRGSAATIKEQLGSQPRHFSFPYGRSVENSREMVGRAGFDSAVAARSDGWDRSGSNPLWIGRVEAPRSMEELKFRTSAAYPGIAGRLGRWR